MDTIISPFSYVLHSLGSFGVWGYWIILFVSFVEALVVVGAFVPGALFVIFAGVLVSKGVYGLWDMIIFASLGAILGDAASYYLGTFGTHLFKDENKFLKKDHLEKGKRFLHKHGGKSLFLGRFIGPLRSILPFVAGLTKMYYPRFLAWNIVGGIVWAVSHVLLGYFLGGSLAVVNRWSLLITLFVLAIIAAFALIWIFVKHSEFLLRFSKLYAILLLGFLIYQLADIIFLGESSPRIDVLVNDWFLRIRDSELIWFFSIVTLLGSVVFVIPLAIGTSIFFYYHKLERYIVALWCALVTAGSTTFLLKIFIARPRPLDGLLIENDFSFPSGHATVAMALYGTLLFLLIKHANSKLKRNSYIVATIAVIALIGLSRLYLGVHFLSDIVGGYFVGLLGLLIATYVYTHYARLRAGVVSLCRFHKKRLY